MRKLTSLEKSCITLGSVIFCDSVGENSRTCKELAIYRTFFNLDKPEKHIYLSVNVYSYDRFLKIWSDCDFPKVDFESLIEGEFISIKVITEDGLFSAPAWLDILFTSLKIASMRFSSFLDGIKKLEFDKWDWKGAHKIYSKIINSTPESISKIGITVKECGIIKRFVSRKSKVQLEPKIK